MSKYGQRLEWFVVAACVAVIAFCVIAMSLMMAGCGAIKSGAGEVGGTVAEWVACPTGLIDCGHVYMCEEAADNALGHVEICINDDATDGTAQFDAAELEYGACEPTPRHQGLCKWCSGADCGRGCNAFNGCYRPTP
jgi:hypothetical protein